MNTKHFQVNIESHFLIFCFQFNLTWLFLLKKQLLLFFYLLNFLFKLFLLLLPCIHNKIVMVVTVIVMKKYKVFYPKDYSK